MKDGKRVGSKAPKIQRLVTPVTLQRKRAIRAEKFARSAKSKDEAANYAILLAARVKERKEKHDASVQKRRLSSHRKSESK